MRNVVTGLVVSVAVLVSGGAEAQTRRRSPPAARTLAAPERACVPGAQVACACPGGGSGVQACVSEGTGYGVCFCAPVPLSQSERDAQPVPPQRVARPVLAAPTAARTVRIRRWYGWRIIIEDVLSSALSASGAASGSNVAQYMGAGIFVLGGPVMHWTQGNVGTGFLSLAMRVVFPLAGFGIAYGATSGDADDARLSAGLIGGSVATLAVSVFDSAAMAYRETEVPAGGSASLRLGGGFAAVSGGGVAMLGGTF